MNILYLGDINSIHDFKWVSFFSERAEVNVYFVTEQESFAKLTPEWEAKLKQSNINILPPINNFSLLNFPKTYQSVKQLKRYIKQYEIKVFHALFGSPQAIWLNFIPKHVRKVITTRGSDVLVLLKGVLEQGGIKNKMLGKLLLSGFQKADFIASTSDKQISYLESCGVSMSKMKLVKTGVDIDRIEAQDKGERIATKRDRFIFSARYIGVVYNMEYQIEAIKLLPQEILKNYSFLFVKSRGDRSDYYNSVISQLDSIPGLEYDVCEGLTQQQMWATLKSSALTYMVPKSDGTPNTALECMAGRVPFIMGNLDYNKELFTNVSLVADLSDAKSFSLALQEGVTNYPENLLDNAASIVKEFGSREAEMNKLASLYSELNA